jgi:hypothetical protein
METIAGVSVDTDEGGSVILGGARFSPHDSLRLCEALVRASFRAAINQEAAATDPEKTIPTGAAKPERAA